jgi:hypothetical protein
MEACVASPLSLNAAPHPLPDQPGSEGFGAVAQLGERCNGIAEVRGSIPLGSTNLS